MIVGRRSLLKLETVVAYFRLLHTHVLLQTYYGFFEGPSPPDRFSELLKQLREDKAARVSNFVMSAANEGVFRVDETRCRIPKSMETGGKPSKTSQAFGVTSARHRPIYCAVRPIKKTNYGRLIQINRVNFDKQSDTKEVSCGSEISHTAADRRVVEIRRS